MEEGKEKKNNMEPCNYFAVWLTDVWTRYTTLRIIFMFLEKKKEKGMPSSDPPLGPIVLRHVVLNNFFFFFVEKEKNKIHVFTPTGVARVSRSDACGNL